MVASDRAPKSREGTNMCRSIKALRPPYNEPTDAEIKAAALQYVRKISGFRSPSRANQPAFDNAVDEIAKASAALLGALEVRAAKAGRG